MDWSGRCLPQQECALKEPLTLPCPTQFSYVDADGSPVNVVQLTFLKLLSAAAHQRFTYSCQNSVAWLDEAAGDYGRSIRFQGTNWEELSFNQTQAATVKVSHDGCRVRPWSRIGMGALGWSGELSTHSCSNSPSMPSRGQLRKGQAKTLFEFSSSHAGFLPLWDVAAIDFGQMNQKFGFELGPICFRS